MTTQLIATLEAEITKLEYAIEQGWAKDHEQKLANMKQELEQLKAEGTSQQDAVRPTGDDHQVSSQDAEGGNPTEQVDTEDCQSELIGVMAAKDDVLQDTMPKLSQASLDFIKTLSVAQTFASNSVHTMLFEVPDTLKDPVVKALSWISFSAICSENLMDREIKNETAKLPYAPIFTTFTRDSKVAQRNMEGDKALNYGCQNIVFSGVHNCTNTLHPKLGEFKLDFESTDLTGLKTEVDEDLDLKIDQARFLQKAWRLKYKDHILNLSEQLDQHKPSRLSADNFEKYKILLAIAKIWGAQQFNNVLGIVGSIALTSGIEDHEKFACTLNKALQETLALFTVSLEHVPSDTLIEQLNKFEGVKYSRQTLPSAMQSIGVNDRQAITFFGTSCQGYSITLLEEKIKPHINTDVGQKYLTSLQRA